MNNKALLLIAAGAAIIPSTVLAQKTFTVVGDKLAYRNLATVESETEFETFTGKTTGVSGSIIFDPKKKTGSGTLVVDAASIDTGIPTRNDHMRSEGWINTAKFPTIKFVATSVKSLGNDNYRVAGNLTLKGVTKPIVASVRVRYRPEGSDTRRVGFQGDVIQVAANFNIKLSDYGIKIPDVAKGKVSPTVKLSVSAYATSK